MLFQKRSFPCIDIFFCVILSTFSHVAHADFDTREDKMLEERLHKIFEEHYSRPVLDSDWFKIVDAAQDQSYTVKKGDTLWGISKIYFGDGFYWSKLWSVNRAITNPHEINVSDTLNFKSGSFVSAPSVDVDRGEGEDISPGEDAPQPRAMIQTTNMEHQAFDIPLSFKNTPLMVYSGFPKVVIEERTIAPFQSHIRLTQEILNKRPTVLGSVVSLGEDRIATGEDNRMVVESSKGLTEGSELAVVDENFSGIDKGYQVKVRGRIRVGRSITRSTYEAVVIEQFDSLLVGSPLIDYTVNTVNLKVDGDVLSPDVKVVSSADKAFWANGDFIFLDGKNANVNSGDLISISNQFARDVNLYYHVGVVKVVSVSPPYATGVVMYSRAVMNEHSISAQ